MAKYIIRNIQAVNEGKITETDLLINNGRMLQMQRLLFFLSLKKLSVLTLINNIRLSMGVMVVWNTQWLL